MSEKLAQDIIDWLHQVFQQAGKSKAVIGVSGGIDSATALTLLTQALGPTHVFPVLMPYQQQDLSDGQTMIKWNQIPDQNVQLVPITPMVDAMAKSLDLSAGDARTQQTTSSIRIRLGNVMARCRMIVLFDQAKKLDALVCGTENKSEKYLGYFTRFGDGASDVEPITHLYKTQVRELAQDLGIPKQIIQKTPSAGLWAGQTDATELGFEYQLADQVLEQLVDQHKPAKSVKIPGIDRQSIDLVIRRYEQNQFKQLLPYHQGEE